MHFLAPIKLGWIVNIKAKVNYASKSSCEVGVKIEAENPLTNEFHHTASAYVTMVSLDSHGKPTKIPELELENELEERRYSEAQERRKARLQLKENLEKRLKS